MERTSKTRLHTRITAEQKAFVTALAEKKHVTEGDIFRMILEAYMKNHGK